jgi:hypothetical protein
MLYVEATSESGSLRTATGRIPQFNMMRHITDQLLEIAQVEIDNAKLKPQSFVLGYRRRELREAVGPSQRRGDGSCQVGLGGSWMFVTEHYSLAGRCPACALHEALEIGQP